MGSLYERHRALLFYLGHLEERARVFALTGAVEDRQHLAIAAIDYARAMRELARADR